MSKLIVFSDRIIICSERLIGEYNLEMHKNKILLAHEHFIDFNEFKIEKQFFDRDKLVGFIGRLSEEKGILNFIERFQRS